MCRLEQTPEQQICTFSPVDITFKHDRPKLPHQLIKMCLYLVISDKNVYRFLQNFQNTFIFIRIFNACFFYLFTLFFILFLFFRGGGALVNIQYYGPNGHLTTE